MRIGLSITKSVSFRNSTQEFSNVYYYEGYPSAPSVAQADGFIDDQTAREKPLHATNVTFVRGRLWSQLGDKSQNEMISQKNLSGTGTASQTPSMDKERAVLVRKRAGNDSRGNPVYLRKWFHVCGQIAGVVFTAGILENSTGLSQTQRDNIAALMPQFDTLGPIGNQGTICAKGGRQPGAGQQWTAHAFLEHHQLGDQWRAQ